MISIFTASRPFLAFLNLLLQNLHQNTIQNGEYFVASIFSRSLYFSPKFIPNFGMDFAKISSNPPSASLGTIVSIISLVMALSSPSRNAQAIIIKQTSVSVMCLSSTWWNISPCRTKMLFVVHKIEHDYQVLTFCSAHGTGFST